MMKKRYPKLKGTVMTLNFFSTLPAEYSGKERYYVSQLDSDTYQVIDSLQDREICVCSNYDNWEDAKERANIILKLLNDHLTK